MKTMLSGQGLRTLRAVRELDYPDLCTVIEPGVKTRTEALQIKEGTPVETPTVRCRLSPLGAHTAIERAIADRLNVVQPAMVSFPHDQVISQRAKLYFPTLGDTYEVRGFVPRTPATRLSLRVVAEKVG